MKNLIVAGLMAVTSLGAMANSNIGEAWGQDAVSGGPGLTRAQVIAELREAQANGTIAYGEATPTSNATSLTSTLTRRQVREEVQALRRAGQLPVHSERGSARF